MSTLHDYINDLKPTGNLSLILATLWVINNGYAKQTAATLTIGKYAENQASLRYQNDLIEGILMRSTTSKDGGMNIKYYLDGRNMHEIEDFANDDNADGLTDEEIFYRSYGNREIAIWFIDSLEAFDRLEADLLSERNHYHRNGFFCLIYTGHERNRMENMNILFDRLFAMYMVNVNVFMLMDSTPFVFTYFPFGKKRCHSSRPQFHFSFRTISTDSDFTIKKNIFPNKVSNMYGCELVVSTWNDPPFVLVEKNEQTGELISLRGIEGMLLSLLAEKMNFSIKIVEPPTRDRGSIFENGTATGAMKMIIDGEADITIDCYMYEKTRADAMLPAFNYMTSAILLAIPKGQPMTSYQRLLRPFKYIIWSCLGTSVLLGILVIFCLKLLQNTKVANFVFGQHNRIPFTNLWTTLYGVPVYGHLPRRNFARYLLTAWLLYTFILRSAYISELFVMLQDGRARSTLKTINEAVHKNYTFFTYPPLAKVLKEAVGATNIQLIGSADNSLTNLLNRLNSEDAKFLVPVIEHYIANYNQQKSNYQRRLNVLSQQLIIVPVTFYMRKHSYIKYEVNSQLMDILAAGMMERFEEYYLESEINTNVGKVHLPTVLSLQLIFSVFIVYLILLSFCVLVFLLELWSTHSPLVTQLFDFFNY